MKKLYQLLLLLLPAGVLHAQTTFNYSGSVQSYTVPLCVNSITVDVQGASGGNNNANPGGLGGRVQAVVPVTPGEVLQIFVGQTGANTQGSHPGVYNGGGGVYSYSSGGTSGTGGGATDIRRSPYTIADRIVIAGGGGGAGYQSTAGGQGGGLNAQAGVPFPSWPSSGGQGGTQSAGGSQGVACCSCPTYTTAGSLGQGGFGAGDGAGGGGGGGGYYGGGGACFAGGGGGSSYTDPTATGVIHAQGFRSGDGVVTISSSASVLSSPTGFTGSTTVCTGSTANYSITAVSGATSYTWTVPSGTTINSGQGTTSISVTFGLSSGTISVTADNTCGSSSPSMQAITVNPAPTVALGTDITQCGGSVLLDAGNAGSTFLWSNASTSQTLVALLSGTYSVVVTSANGCTGSDAINITIHNNPAITLGSDVTQCGGTVLLDAGVSGINYLWNDASTNQTLLASSSGMYYVTGTDANGCSKTDSVSVTIHTLPAVAGSAANMLPCAADGAVALNGSPAGGTWSGPGVSGNSFDPGTAGVGTHTLVYTFADSLTTCSDTAQVNITVDICLGMADVSNAGINIFPNPVTDVLQVKSDKPLSTYTIMDINGRIVLSGNFISTANGRIDVASLSAGTYLLRTTEKSGVVSTVQFIKE